MFKLTSLLLVVFLHSSTLGDSKGVQQLVDDAGLKNMKPNLEPEMSNRGLWKRSIQQKDEKVNDAELKNMEANLKPEMSNRGLWKRSVQQKDKKVSVDDAGLKNMEANLEPAMSNRGLWKRSAQQKDEKDVCEDSEPQLCPSLVASGFCTKFELVRDICKKSCGACTVDDAGLKNMEANPEPERSNRGLWKRSAQQKDGKVDDAELKNMEANLEPENSNKGLWKRSVQQKDEKDVCEDSGPDFCQNFVARKFCESEKLRNICKKTCEACSGEDFGNSW